MPSLKRSLNAPESGERKRTCHNLPPSTVTESPVLPTMAPTERRELLIEARDPLAPRYREAIEQLSTSQAKSILLELATTDAFVVMKILQVHRATKERGWMSATDCTLASTSATRFALQEEFRSMSRLGAHDLEHLKKILATRKSRRTRRKIISASKRFRHDQIVAGLERIDHLISHVKNFDEHDQQRITRDLLEIHEGGQLLEELYDDVELIKAPECQLSDDEKARVYSIVSKVISILYRS